MTNVQNDREVIDLCLADGAEGVRQMMTDVRTLADLFRRRDIAPAHVAMAQLAQDLGALIVLIDSLREPVASFASAAALPSSDDVEQMARTLESVVSAQAAQDWLTVSDVLEFDLEPGLTTWLARLESASAAMRAA